MKVRVTPASATLALDGAPVGAGGVLDTTLPRDGREHVLVISAPDHAQQTLRFTDASPPEAVTLSRAGNNGAPIVR